MRKQSGEKVVFLKNEFEHGDKRGVQSPITLCKDVYGSRKAFPIRAHKKTLNFYLIEKMKGEHTGQKASLNERAR